MSAARRVFNPHELAAASLRLIANLRRKVASERAASVAQSAVSHHIGNTTPLFHSFYAA